MRWETLGAQPRDAAATRGSHTVRAKPWGTAGPRAVGLQTMPGFIAASQMERMGNCQLEPIN